MDIANSIDWNSIEEVLMGHYQIGTSKEGADVYPPLLLFKCLLLQKWFHMDSDCIFRTIANTIPIDREQCSDPSRTAFCLIANTIPEHPEQRNTNY